MKLLLDSHVFLWLLNDPERLGTRTRQLLELDSNEACVSVVSIWELGLKYKKVKQPYSISEMLRGVTALQVNLMDLRQEHLARFEKIDLAHKDPFDMLLVAQSEAENGMFLTADSTILRSKYNVCDAER